MMDYICDKYKIWCEARQNPCIFWAETAKILIQEGMIGLFKAVRDYDCGRDASLPLQICVSADRCTRQCRLQAPGSTHRSTAMYLCMSEAARGTDNEEKNLIEALAARTQMSPEELFLDKERVEDLERELLRQNSAALKNRCWICT